MTTHNAAGQVFINPDLQLVVLRWRDHTNLNLAQHLVDLALAEMGGIGATALIYDLRKISSHVGMRPCIDLVCGCLESDLVERLAFLVPEGWMSSFSPAPSAVKIAEEQDIKLYACDDFAQAAAWLDSHQTNPDGPFLAKEQLPDFWGTYAGSFYSIPEYSCTVLRTAGNTLELLLAAEVFEKAYALHRSAKNEACIVDTSASPPLTDMLRYQFTYNEVIKPLTDTGMFKRIVHVRVGDAIEGKAPPLAPLVEALGIPYFEVSSVKQALKIVQILKGRVSQDLPVTE